ncbi:MAG: YggT family protein [Gammaproteobacteria bacterium]|nr:MAG: YggT family protein [Gammaproteobacteria bacterium]
MGQQILALIIQFVGSFYATIVLLRFLLQWARADFYNPISQFVVKATNPLLLPLRRLIPGFGGLDIAALVLGWLVMALMLTGLFAVSGFPLSPGFIAGLALIKLAEIILNVYFWAIIAVIALSWIAPGSYHPAAILLHQLTEPVMKPFRKVIPPMGGLDLSPIIVFLVINILEIVLNNLARGLVGY